ncbi:MAG: oligopeptide/dipeptide ABC transporter ATP-binding protein, partial [Pyrinomonadaceae bacterium]
TAVGKAKAERLRTIEGTVPSPTDLPPGCHFAPRCEHRMERCTVGEIPFYECADGTKVRCVLYNDRPSTAPAR